MTFRGPDAGRPQGRQLDDGPRTYGSVTREQVPLRSPDGPLRGRPNPPRPHPHRADRRGRLTRFVDTFGWRAYALPVLAVATILGLSNIAAGGAPSSSPSRQQTARTPGATTTPSPGASAKPTPSAKPT